ncbi:MAG: HD domain-containing protein [Pseudomonadaceae bacterium]|nr:HD domain-containing protein [Pseudomonadaceae bacterium]
MTPDIHLLYELGQLAQIQRSYLYTTGAPSVAAHIHRVAMTALILARAEGANVEKVLLMALVHDTPETRTGDPTPFQKPFIKKDDHFAAQTQFGETSLADMVEVLAEYEARETPEAKIVKDADMLVAEMEMCELTARGHTWSEYYADYRASIRPRLRTETAKKMFDLIGKTNPLEWTRKGPNAYKAGTHGT